MVRRRVPSISPEEARRRTFRALSIAKLRSDVSSEGDAGETAKAPAPWFTKPEVLSSGGDNAPGTTKRTNKRRDGA